MEFGKHNRGGFHGSSRLAAFETFVLWKVI